jgi:hypothetical protein
MDYSAEIGASVLHADHPGIDGLMPISIKHDFILLVAVRARLEKSDTARRRLAVSLGR